MTLHLSQPLDVTRFDAPLEGAHRVTRRTYLYRDIIKRLLDITLVLIAFVPAVLLMLPFALLIARDGKSPLYFQRRVGRGGRVFLMWKLRSMVPNAESLLEAYLADNPEARVEWDVKQKLMHDPRITPIGRLIRKASIDELPQLWNVLRGDMSIVGPRPMLTDQRDIYPGTAYYALRPGITGFWQTSERNETSFEERAAYDTAYLQSLTFGTDLKIILRTVRVVVVGTGV